MDNVMEYFRVIIINMNKYENEVEIMRDIKKKCDENELRSLLISLKENEGEDLDEQKKTAENLIMEGNKIFNEKNNVNLTVVIRLYTQAILAASPGEILALAHAQRSAALQENGYYQQAYDDCVVAIEQGYPENLKHEVQFRQAYCAWKIGDLELLLRHLDELEKKKLNNNFAEEIQQLRLKSKEMQKNAPIGRTKSDQSMQHILLKDCLEITYASEGRHLIAKKEIAENEIVCIERAPSFVRISNDGMCENCAITLFIPFPCKYCRNEVVYCSLACLREHYPVHKIECPGIRLNIFSKIGLENLTLRILLDGVPQLLPLLQKCTNIDKLWRKLMSGTAIKTNYGYTLQLESPLQKVTLKVLVHCTTVAQIALVYLKEYTTFFDIFANVKMNRKQKELLVGSLLLRHVGQMLIHGFVLASIVPAYTVTSFSLLQDDLWYRPFHVQRGKLHTFSQFKEIGSMIFPYIGIAHNSCEPSFTPRISGRYITAYATKRMAPCEELTHTYAGSYLTSRKEKRYKILKNLYYTACSCAKCNREFPDQDYEKFRQYRCELNDCRKIFAHEDDNITASIFCEDGHEQKKPWLIEFDNLCELVHNESDRRKLYNFFYNVDGWLIGFSTYKIQMAHQLTVRCFDAFKAGVGFVDDEFEILGDIIQFNLDGIEQLYRANSLQYTAKMFYLWDIIALGKYKCTEDQTQKMLGAVQILSDEIKMICMNYFNNFMKVHLQ